MSRWQRLFGHAEVATFEPPLVLGPQLIFAEVLDLAIDERVERAEEVLDVSDIRTAEGWQRRLVVGEPRFAIFVDARDFAR